MAARSKAWFCGRLLAGIVGLNPAGWHGYLSVVIVMCCLVEASATSLLLIQRSTTECRTSLRVIMKPRDRRGHGPRWAALPLRKKKLLFFLSRKRDLNDCEADRLYRLTLSLTVALSIGLISVDPPPRQFFNLRIGKIYFQKHFPRFIVKTMEKVEKLTNIQT